MIWNVCGSAPVWFYFHHLTQPVTDVDILCLRPLNKWMTLEKHQKTSYTYSAPIKAIREQYAQGW